MFIEIGKKHPLFNAVSWVLRARSKDATRFVLQYLHAEDVETGMEIVCTDGKRMHCSLLAGNKETIPAGNYRVLKHTASVIWLLTEVDRVTYPMWRQIKPDITALTPKPVITDGRSESSLLEVAAYRFGKGFFNRAYLVDAAYILPKGAHEVMFYVSPDMHTPMVLTHTLGLAVVMPMRERTDWLLLDEQERVELAHYRDEHNAKVAKPEGAAQ